MKYVYQPKGVCSRSIAVELDGDVIKSVTFYGGCSGNTQGLARMLEGASAAEAIRRLRGIRCGFRPTSCPDQLTYALEEALARGGKATD